MQHILPDNLFCELTAVMIGSVPNLLNIELPSAEVVTFLYKDNLPTVAKNLELVNKAILKKESNHLSIDFKRHLAYFIPNLGVIKLGILDKKNKKPHMYRHGCLIL